MQCLRPRYGLSDLASVFQKDLQVLCLCSHSLKSITLCQWFPNLIVLGSPLGSFTVTVAWISTLDSFSWSGMWPGQWDFFGGLLGYSNVQPSLRTNTLLYTMQPWIVSRYGSLLTIS